MTGVSPDLEARYGAGGYFALFVRPPSGAWKNITFFRDVPTKIGSFSWTDPFGASTAQITFPAITGHEKAGTGDMKWLIPHADINIQYFDLNTGRYSDWIWEGYFVDEGIGGSDGRVMTCKGALFQVDNFLAAPQYLQQPMPYELHIREAFDPIGNPSLRTRALRTVFPDDWNEVVPTYSADTPWYMKPWGVTAGQKWTSLTSRSSGSWEPKLTGFVQTLLSVMYTSDGGQWTIRHEKNRQPVLQVRPALRYPTEKTYEVEFGIHGVKVQVNRDFTQSVNVVYAQGQDIAGTSFSGQQVANDGSTTFYEPFAALPHVYPATDTNPRLLPYLMRKETMLQIPQGIDENAARDIAHVQIRKHSDPGYTGTVTLNIDPQQGGETVPRFLIKAGDTIMVHKLVGTSILFHISDATIDIDSGTVTLSVDSKFRDALTVAEVKARTRDALDPVRLLQAGRYSATVQDLVKPWSYAEGSGVIPSGGASDATPLFTRHMNNDARFPWTDYTTKFPPKDYPQYYIKIPKRNVDANLNWSSVTRNDQPLGIPIKMSQAGTIRLTQIAAYDKNGNVKPVSFHVGLYGANDVSWMSMPSIPNDWLQSNDPEAKRARDIGYTAGQHYPFFKDAFEQQKSTGEQQGDPSYLVRSDVNQVIAWGTYYERAGYSPGLMSKVGRDNATGLLVDESQWSFDTSTINNFNPYNADDTAKNPNAGMLYMMIYCDDHDDEDVYFLGRMFRTEPTGK